MKKNRTTAKSQLFGYALYVKSPNEDKYQREGHLFETRLSAEQYRFRHFTRATAWRIQGVRLDPRPGVEHYPLPVAGPKGRAA